MRLHGIELAKPDEWYRADGDGDTQLTGFIHIDDGNSCHIEGLESLDMFVFREGDRWGVASGITGAWMARGFTEAHAIQEAIYATRLKGAQFWVDRLIQWLETHPLSPRYRYTGGG